MIKQNLFHTLFSTKIIKFGKRLVHTIDVKEKRMIVKILIILGGFRNLKNVSFESIEDVREFYCKHRKKILKDTSIFFLCRSKKEELLFICVRRNNKGEVSFKKYTLKLDVWDRIAIVFPPQITKKGERKNEQRKKRHNRSIV